MTALQLLAGLAWYDVDDPNSSALDELARQFHLHELQIEDCRHRPQRAKAEEHEQYVFIVLKRIHPNQQLVFDDVDVFIGQDFIITVHQGENELMSKVRVRAQQDASKRVDRLLYLLVDTLVDEYLPVLDQLAEDISEIEGTVLTRPEPAMLAQIFQLKRRLIEFRRITAAMREVVNAIARREHGCVGDDLDPYFRDIYDHLVRTLELIETYRDLLTGSLEVYLSAVANRTNEVMKVLTVYGTVALPLVIITGFFGMNLPIGWSQNPNGAAYAGALMVVSTLVVLAYFKLKKWF
jgi:magnesium transporter